MYSSHSITTWYCVFSCRMSTQWLKFQFCMTTCVGHQINSLHCLILNVVLCANLKLGGPILTFVCCCSHACSIRSMSHYPCITVIKPNDYAQSYSHDTQTVAVSTYMTVPSQIVIFCPSHYTHITHTDLGQLTYDIALYDNSHRQYVSTDTSWIYIWLQSHNTTKCIQLTGIVGRPTGKYNYKVHTK